MHSVTKPTVIADIDGHPIEGDPARVEELFQAHQNRIYRRTDQVFAYLMTFQWIAGILFALWVSPRAWAGTTSTVNIHVYAAIFLGGAITFFPVLLVFLKPGATITRQTIGVAQMLVG